MRTTAKFTRGKGEALSDWRQRVLATFTRLHDKAAQRTAADELTREIDELDETTLPVFVSMLLDTCATKKVALCKESFRLVAITAASHKSAMAPFVPKIVSAVVRSIKEPTLGAVARESCADALGMVARNVPPPPDSGASEHTALGVYLKPLLALLAEQDKAWQAGAAMCITAVIENSRTEFVLRDLPRLLQRIAERMDKPCTQVHGLLLDTLAKAAEVAGEQFIPHVPLVVPLATASLDSAEWQARKSAADLLVTLARRLGPAMNPFRAELAKSLAPHKFDKVPPAREAITAALREFSDAPKDAAPQAAGTGTQHRRAVSSTARFSERRTETATALTEHAGSSTATGIGRKSVQQVSDLGTRGKFHFVSAAEEPKKEAADIFQPDLAEFSAPEALPEAPVPEEPAEELPGDKREAPRGAKKQAPIAWEVGPGAPDDEVAMAMKEVMSFEQGPEAEQEPEPAPEPEQPRTKPASGIAFSVDKASFGAKRRPVTSATIETDVKKPSATLVERPASSPQRAQRASAAVSGSSSALLDRLRRVEQQQAEMRSTFQKQMEENDIVISELQQTIRRLEQLVVSLKEETRTSEKVQGSNPTKQATPTRQQQQQPPGSSPKPSSPAATKSPPKPRMSSQRRGQNEWDRAASLIGLGQMDAAFRAILSANDLTLLLRLMEMSGPVLDSLEEPTRIELINCLMPQLEDDQNAPVILPWIGQVLNLPPPPADQASALVATLEIVAKSSSDHATAAGHLVEALKEKWYDVLV